jgi:hypothetical protein
MKDSVKLTYEERYHIWFKNNFETGMEYNPDIVPDFDNEYYVPTPTTKPFVLDEGDKDLYNEIEHFIIRWNNDGTKTAGTLTRQIVELIKKQMSNNKAREHTSPLIEELLNEVTPEEMERTNREMENMGREFDNTKLNYIANTLKETANRMEYIGDISDLGNEIGHTVGDVYKDMTKEDIDDFISGFIHGISLTNRTH